MLKIDRQGHVITMTIDRAESMNPLGAPGDGETFAFWPMLLGGLFLYVSYYGCDQSQVQRYLTARSLDESRTSLLMSAFLKIPLQFL